MENKEVAVSVKMVGMASTCSAAPSDGPRLAALGVFTADRSTNALHRASARRTWLSPMHQSKELLTVFVARGIGASSSLVAERVEHGDIVFVNFSASMGRAQGPLALLLSWLQCVTQTMPNVKLVGKADDDVLIMLPGIASHLRGSLYELRRLGGAPAHMLWGLQESYHWDRTTHRPDGFDDAYAYKRDCMEQNPQLKKTRPLGPFNFAKGACFFLSTPLAGQLAFSPAFEAEVFAAMDASEDTSASMAAALARLENPEALPWEDVLLGWGLTVAVHDRVEAGRGRNVGGRSVGGRSVGGRSVGGRSVGGRSGSGDGSSGSSDGSSGDGSSGGGGGSRGSTSSLAYVHAGRVIYTEEWFSHGAGLGMAPSTLILHNRGKRPARIARAHRWARTHHCHAERVQLTCDASTYTSCTGARWRRCTASNQPLTDAGCSTAIQFNLSGRAAAPQSCILAARDRLLAKSGGGGVVRPRASAFDRAMQHGMRGHCGETEFGDSDCQSDDFGAWRISSPLVNGTLLGCMARCACCEQCRYISYSPADDDCSWYRECGRLTRQPGGPVFVRGPNVGGGGARGTVSVQLPLSARRDAV